MPGAALLLELCLIKHFIICVGFLEKSNVVSAENDGVPDFCSFLKSLSANL